jgi:hypothetical protein
MPSRFLTTDRPRSNASCRGGCGMSKNRRQLPTSDAAVTAALIRICREFKTYGCDRASVELRRLRRSS